MGGIGNADAKGTGGYSRDRVRVRDRGRWMQKGQGKDSEIGVLTPQLFA